MALSERSRRELFDGFNESHGEAFANNIMELLPRHASNELVTRDDMSVFGNKLTAELRGEMAELRAELRGEMAELRGEMRGEFRALEGRFDSKFAELQVNTERLFAGAIVGNAIAVVTALVA